MISYIKGTLASVGQDAIVVESGSGVGFGIHVPLSVLERLPAVGERITIYTYFQVREDAMVLFGFLSRQDREMFQQLIGVNGIGPKAALGILSALRPDELRLAIVNGDAKAISRAPGVGSKTAQRLILDLKDRISADELLASTGYTGAAGGPAGEAGAEAGMAEAAREAIQALVALGYTGAEASRAVKQVEITDGMDAEAVLKASLRHLTFL